MPNAAQAAVHQEQVMNKAHPRISFATKVGIPVIFQSNIDNFTPQ